MDNWMTAYAAVLFGILGAVAYVCWAKAWDYLEEDAKEVAWAFKGRLLIALALWHHWTTKDIEDHGQSL